MAMTVPGPAFPAAHRQALVVKPESKDRAKIKRDKPSVSSTVRSRMRPAIDGQGLLLVKFEDGAAIQASGRTTAAPRFAPVESGESSLIHRLKNHPANARDDRASATQALATGDDGLQ